ncbi:UbiA family prenyltransferase [Micromonospora peucetia]|uniref:4-hydroxybenzoate polyprenyltransferase n=1 Tax=Micromonospora peucetia TaxID=47871 RepID=A0A1C6V387_9ACTN|nr:UbiA family prenyltransferase [Micromonospora peucetia]MCX4389104.1 UbiA family prenyltransferase [Micromonospora peucetia]WSA35306.1 UbiA family prenyltransferase [Micromonospora peucetia]SCL60811.1 4-hydroxybenzoate polyprenyltransferase [Micromonospora peucetia]
MSPTVLGLVRASHPEPAAAVTTVAGLLAWGVGHRPAGVLAVVLTVAASQLAVGWANDALDADRDATVGRTDKPVAAGAVSRRVTAVAAAVAALATPLLALVTGPAAALFATLGLVSALLYDWPLKSTPVSVLPYAVSFGSLPAFVVLALPGSVLPPVWLVAAAACLGAGAHFANVLPDLADDARTGVRGLPHRLGSTGSRAAAALLLLAATATLVLGPPGPPSGVGVAAVATAVVVPPLSWYGGRAAARAGGRQVAAFRAVLLVALIDVVLLVTSGRLV